MPNNKSFFPGAEVPLAGWFDHFDDSIDEYASILNISPDMVSALKTAGGAASGSIGDVVSARASYLSTVAAKKLNVANAKTLFRDQVALLKRQPGYTEEIGRALGVIPPENPFDPNTYQAKILSVVNFASEEVRVRFDKAYGNISGVNLYFSRPPAPDLQFAGFFGRVPAEDDTPLATPGTPEVRLYCCRGVIGNDEIGLMSETMRVVVS